MCEERLALGVAYHDALDDLAILACLVQSRVAVGVVWELCEVGPTLDTLDGDKEVVQADDRYGAR